MTGSPTGTPDRRIAVVSESTCEAPAIGMYLFPNGDVRPCCYNPVPLGNVADSGLLDIWWGGARSAMVDELDGGSYPTGCDWCASQVALEGRAGSGPGLYDRYASGAGRQRWPERIEFNLSNSCNLCCIQCNGDLSSSIRSRREQRPPLPRAYGESFFEDLREFLPHLSSAQFAGGEPFLAQENFRVWDLVEELNPGLECVVVTNATVWSPRIERVVTAVPMGFVVSLDGATSATYSSIRVGADLDEVLANAERLRKAAAASGSTFSVNFCLMPENHHELADVLLLAEGWGAPVNVSVVRDPPEHSVAAMDPGDIAAVHATMSGRDAELATQLSLNLPVWRRELERVGRWAAAGREAMAGAVGSWARTLPSDPPRFLHFPFLSPVPASTGAGRTGAPDWVLPDGAALEVHWVELGLDESVVDCSPSLAALLHLDRHELGAGGAPAAGASPSGPSLSGEGLRELLERGFGPMGDLEVVHLDDHALHARSTLGGSALRVAMEVHRDARGAATGARVSFSVGPADAAEAEAAVTRPVELSIVVPAFEEEHRLPGTLEGLAVGLDAWGRAWEVVVVDDGSTDATTEVVDAAAATDPRFHLVRLGEHRGKGAALVAGYRAARGDVVVFCDADLPVDVGTLLDMARATRSAPVVVGSRRTVGSSFAVPQPLLRRLGGGVFVGLSRASGFTSTSDPQCGVKAFRRSECAPFVEGARSTRFAYDIEMLSAMRAAGVDIMEWPVRWVHVPGSSIHPARDGLRTLTDLWKLRLAGSTRTSGGGLP